MTEQDPRYRNPFWGPTLRALQEHDPDDAPAIVRERADTWGRGLEVTVPSEHLSEHGVPQDAVLKWLSIRFAHAIFEGDWAKASVVHRLFAVRRNELVHGDNDPFLAPATELENPHTQAQEGSGDDRDCDLDITIDVQESDSASERKRAWEGVF